MAHNIFSVRARGMRGPGLTGEQQSQIAGIETDLAAETARATAVEAALDNSIAGAVTGLSEIINDLAEFTDTVDEKASDALQSVNDQADALGGALAMPPVRAYRREGVWPLAEQGDDILLWIDAFGRIGGQEFVAGPDPEPMTVRDGKMVLRRDANGQPIEWYDYPLARSRFPGDPWDRPDTSIPSASFSAISGSDVTLAIGPDGALMQPASAAAPVPFVKAVDDGAGPIAQVFVATGTATHRLTSSPVDCYNPHIIAPGLVKYARDDGRIALARTWLDESTSATAIEGYLLHGQSLAGGTTDPALYELTAPNPPDQNILMFNGGIRAAFGGSAYDPANFTALVPARESWLSTRGDTGRTCFGFAMKRARRAQILLASSGNGGTAFADLGPGTVIWDNLLYGVTRGKALADAAGKSFVVPAVHWRQGESNSGSSSTDYAAMLDQAIDAIQADIPAITGQAAPPILTMQQINHPTMVSGVYTIFGPGDAQGIVGLTDARAILACPQYLGAFIDVYHMTPEAYARMDAYAAKATRRHLYEGRPWKPLHMASAVRSGRKIIVTIAGGTVDYGGAIQVDTSFVTDPGQRGFVFRDSTDSATVVAAEVIGRNQIMLWLSAVPSGTGAQIGAAYWAPWATSSPAQGPATGLRTCIRDNDPECCPFTGLPLHNYLISQKIGVTS